MKHLARLVKYIIAQVREEAFAEWGLGVLDSLRTPEVLRPKVHGESVRFEAEHLGGLVNDALSREKDSADWWVLHLWRLFRNGCPPQGWQPHQQLARELAEALSEMPQQGAQKENLLLNLWKASEGTRVLRDALSALQNYWRSTEGQEANQEDMFDVSATSERARTLWEALHASEEGQTAPVSGGVGVSMAVRRLTPLWLECERLQGFVDNYTAIPHRGKMAADGPRYKALGNSMAVPVMRWIGQRIRAVEDIKA